MNNVTAKGAAIAGFTGSMIASTIMWGFACVKARVLLVPDDALVMQYAFLVVPIANAIYKKVLQKFGVDPSTDQ